MIAWLHGEGHGEVGVRVPASEAELLAPVPRPPSVRDFFAFEGHVEAGWRRRGGEIPPAWYEAPVFYFSNPASIQGPGATVETASGHPDAGFRAGGRCGDRLCG